MDAHCGGFNMRINSVACQTIFIHFVMKNIFNFLRRVLSLRSQKMRTSVIRHTNRQLCHLLHNNFVSQKYWRLVGFTSTCIVPQHIKFLHVCSVPIAFSLGRQVIADRRSVGVSSCNNTALLRRLCGESITKTAMYRKSCRWKSN